MNHLKRIEALEEAAQPVEDFSSTMLILQRRGDSRPAEYPDEKASRPSKADDLKERVISARLRVEPAFTECELRELAKGDGPLARLAQRHLERGQWK